MWDSRMYKLIDSVTEFLNLNDSLITNVQITYDTNFNQYVVFFCTLKSDNFIYEYHEEID